MTLLHSLRIHARKAGLEVRKADYSAIESIRLAKQLHGNMCDVVLDVGANVGQFAAELFDEGGYRGEIVSFEPIPQAHARLASSAEAFRRRGRNWRAAPCVAVGDETRQSTLYISENIVSSSLAHIATAHLEAAPTTRVTGSIDVEVRTLQSLVTDLGITSNRIFLKMDTQGTEDQVLAGGAPIMDRIAGIKVELSAVELYEGQKLYPEMDDLIRGLGFQLWDVVAGARNHSSLQMLQFDGVYFRAPSARAGKE
jgi:FkbM family methyltransferase